MQSIWFLEFAFGIDVWNEELFVLQETRQLSTKFLHPSDRQSGSQRNLGKCGFGRCSDFFNGQGLVSFLVEPMQNLSPSLQAPHHRQSLYSHSCTLS